MNHFAPGQLVVTTTSLWVDIKFVPMGTVAMFVRRTGPGELEILVGHVGLCFYKPRHIIPLDEFEKM